MSGPYAEMALHYLPEWSPIPITTVDGNKVPLVRGHHGYKGAYVTPAQSREWIASEWVHPRGGVRFRDAGIGLRVPRDVIGIDVDRYGGKAGGRTLETLNLKWGRLAPTWSSTSRTDGSGIHLYRLPIGVDARGMKNPAGTFSDGSPLGGIDLIHYGVRYVTCYPTFHGREGGIHQYLWFNPDGEADDEKPEWPLPEDLPYLPNGWCEGLAVGGSSWGNGDNFGKLIGSVQDWLKGRPGGDGPLCAAMQELVDEAVAEVTEAGHAGGCYPVANRRIFQIVGSAAEGHAGALLAVETLWLAYREAMSARTSDRRSPDAVETEFNNSLRGAIEKVPGQKYCHEDRDCELGRMLP